MQHVARIEQHLLAGLEPHDKACGDVVRLIDARTAQLMLCNLREGEVVLVKALRVTEGCLAAFVADAEVEVCPDGQHLATPLVAKAKFIAQDEQPAQLSTMNEQLLKVRADVLVL